MEITQKIKWYKKLTILLTISTIVPTALLMMSLSPAADEKSKQVSQAEARTNISNYRNSAAGAESGINGLRIESGQLEAMNNVAKTNPNTSAYRLYYGKDSVGTDVSIVVGITNDGQDDTDAIYSTARTGSNICPPVCDANSPLTN